MSLRSAAAKVHKGLMNLEGDATDPKLQPHLRLVDDAYINDIEHPIGQTGYHELVQQQLQP